MKFKGIMMFLPISLNVTGKKVLLIGGGRIAYHKITFLEQFSDTIFVVAIDVCEDIKNKSIPYVEKKYEKQDLKGAFLIYACTNIKELNEQVKKDAQELGILCNVVDNPPLCDFVSPAIYKHGVYTVACGSNGQDVYKSIEIRNKIKNFLEHDPSVFQPTQHFHS